MSKLLLFINVNFQEKIKFQLRIHIKFKNLGVLP